MTATDRNLRKTVSGVVTSDKMERTITVRVERVFRHAKYGKYVRRDKKYHAHDENNEAREGDVVTLRECRPLSKLKRWTLVSVDERAAIAGPAVLGRSDADEAVGGEPAGGDA